MRSIRRTLLVGLLGAVLAAGAGTSVLTYISLNREVSQLFDTHLANVAHMLTHQDRLTFDRLAGEFTEPEENDLEVEVFGPDGRLVSTTSPRVRIPQPGSAGFSTLHWEGSEWRVYHLREQDRSILVVQPVNARHEMRLEIAWRNLWPVLALIPVLAVSIWIVVGRALGPMRSIAHTLDTRNPRAMDPLSNDRMPTEVQPLVSAVNDLLARLSHAMDAQRRFIADAAHELRTPLTAVDLQAQLLERASSSRERVAVLGRMRGALKRASHLVHQLLTMARAEPELAAPCAGDVPLREMVTEIVAEFEPLAQAKGIQLRMDRNEAAECPGDPDSLRVLINNVVDNAIRYTPTGGSVEVSVWQSRITAYAEVIDNGRGIPAAEQERVFDRFYRGAHPESEGSGLGLAIVKSIAARHRGAVKLAEGRDGRGLRLTVELPRTPVVKPPPSA